AIDTTVLEAELARDPALATMVRSIDTLGPSPAPPWIFSKAVPEALRGAVTRCLADMHRDVEGAQILGGWGIAELRPVEDADYDLIRSMTRIAASAVPGRSTQGRRGALAAHPTERPGARECGA